MQHRLVIERLFSLGNYSNIKIIAESSSIPDEVWNDADQLRVVRDALEQEVLAGYAQHMAMMEANKDIIAKRDFSTLYNTNA